MRYLYHPFLPGKFRPTPLRYDGTRYYWTLDYDPRAGDGKGRFTFTLRSDGHKAGELEKPDLPESHKQEARNRFPSTDLPPPLLPPTMLVPRLSRP